MTEKQHKEAEKRQEELRKEEVRDLARSRSQQRVDWYVEPWCTPILNQPIFELTWDHITPAMKDKGINEVSIGVLVVTANVTLVVALAWLLSCCSGFLVIILYAGLYYASDGKYIYAVLAVIWIINKVRRIMTMKTDAAYYDEIHYPKTGRQYSQSSWLCEIYTPLAVLLGSAYFIFGTEMGHVLASFWILIVIVVLTRAVPGAGGNSTMGLVTLAFIALLGLITIPDVYRQLLLITRTTLEPRTDTITEPAAQFLYGINYDLDWMSFGYNKNSFTDLMRKALGYVPMMWVMLDDLVGPGLAISEASGVSQKGKDVREQGWAAIYNGYWWIAVLLQFFLAWMTSDVYGLMVLMVTAGATWLGWRIVGKKE